MDRSRRRTAKFVLTTFAFVLVILALWSGFDLVGPHKSKMRNFDPDEVARLETAMWR
jgi:hypothetical protein